MIDIFVTASKNVFRKWVRSLLTLFGIAIGVTSVIVISSAGQCGTIAINQEISALGIGGLSITKKDTLATDVDFNTEDLNQLGRIEDVEKVTPILTEYMSVKARNVQTNAVIWGVDAGANQIISLKILYGRGILDKDVKNNAKVCLVDQSLALQSYSRDNIVGKKIVVQMGGRSEEFEVVGVVKAGSGLLQNLVGDYIPTFLYLPYTTMQKNTGKTNFTQLAVQVKENSDAEKVGRAIVSSLERSKGKPDSLVVNNLTKHKDGLMSILDIVTLGLSVIGAISLVVASLSIMTVMLVSVNERTREIGIKKSIGARNSTIMLEFLTEAALLSLLGCLAGLILGAGISFAGASYMGFQLTLRSDIIILTVVFSILTGIVFGVYPAAKAARLKPVDALRQD